jgi:hypothetical protein
VRVSRLVSGGLLAALVSVLAACTGSSSSPAPGPLPALNPGGTPHAQYVVVSDVGNNSMITYNLGTSSTPNSGNLAPAYKINGASTGISTPWYAFNDFNSNLWIAETGTTTLSWFSMTTNGNHAPINTISGSNTTFVQIDGVYIAPNGTIYVVDQGALAIDVFAAGSHGNVAPTARIVGSNTTLAGPIAITADASGHIWVADYAAPALDEFSVPASGTNNVAPLARITSSALSEPETIYMDYKNRIWVGDVGNGSILAFAASGGNQTPLCTIAGSNTGFNSIGYQIGVAVDNGGYVYEAGTYSPTINIFAPGACGNVSPQYTITGGSTGMSHPGSILVYSTGNDY